MEVTHQPQVREHLSSTWLSGELLVGKDVVQGIAGDPPKVLLHCIAVAALQAFVPLLDSSASNEAQAEEVVGPNAYGICSRALSYGQRALRHRQTFLIFEVEAVGGRNPHVRESQRLGWPEWFEFARCPYVVLTSVSGVARRRVGTAQLDAMAGGGEAITKSLESFDALLQVLDRIPPLTGPAGGVPQLTQQGRFFSLIGDMRQGLAEKVDGLAISRLTVRLACSLEAHRNRFVDRVCRHEMPSHLDSRVPRTAANDLCGAQVQSLALRRGKVLINDLSSQCVAKAISPTSLLLQDLLLLPPLHP